MQSKWQPSGRFGPQYRSVIGGAAKPLARQLVAGRAITGTECIGCDERNISDEHDEPSDSAVDAELIGDASLQWRE